MGHPMRLELILAGLLIKLAIVVFYKAFCLDVAQAHVNEAPIETRTHSCRFASPAY